MSGIYHGVRHRFLSPFGAGCPSFIEQRSNNKYRLLRKHEALPARTREFLSICFEPRCFVPIYSESHFNWMTTNIATRIPIEKNAREMYKHHLGRFKTKTRLRGRGLTVSVIKMLALLHDARDYRTGARYLT